MLNCKRCNEHQATICSHCAGEYGELQTKNEIALWLDSEALEALESYQAQVNKVTGADLTIAEAAAAVVKLKLRESGFLMEEPYKP